MERIKVESLEGSRVSVWFDAELGEYQVKVKGRPAATYYTDDKRDALSTAQAMRNRVMPCA